MMRNGRTVGMRYRDAAIWSVSVIACLVLPFEIFIGAGVFASNIRPINDFTIFYSAGKLVLEGKVSNAYSMSDLSQAIRITTSQHQVGSIYTWAYPPFYDLVVAGLAFGSLAQSYALFMLGTLGSYVWLISRLGARKLRWALTFTLPILIIIPIEGQNGFLLGALAAWFAKEFRRGRAFAGVPLGLMLIKPHLALGLAVLAVFRRQFDVLAWAMATFVVCSAISTAILGTHVWFDVLHGMREASNVLRNANYIMFRMPSLYAALRSLGLSFDVAMAGQLLSAGLALAALYRLQRSELNIDCVLAVAMFVTLLLPPYVYDYDLAIIGVGIALLSPILSVGLKPVQTLLFALFMWLLLAFSLYYAFSTGKSAVTSIELFRRLDFLPGILTPMLFLWISRAALRTAPVSIDGYSSVRQLTDDSP